MKDLEIEIVDKSVKKLYGKTVFITGGTRGVGKEIALKLARDGANIVIVAETDKPHPSKQGTLHTTIQEVEAAGGRGLAILMDIRHENQVKHAVELTVRTFGGIDILINNASAISLADTEETDMNSYDLINSVNARGTFLVTKMCLPHLKKSTTPHVLCIAPPINLRGFWFAGRVAYAIAKYGMSMCVMGMAEEFRGYGISVNALWPRVVIEKENMVEKQVCRKPTIMGEAAYAILTMDPRPFGEFFLDDQALAQVGMRRYDSYCVDPSFVNKLVLNAFVDDSGTIVQKKIRKTTVEMDKSETADKMEKILEKFESLFDEALVKKTQKVFQITVTGDDHPKKAYIDLKNGKGAFRMGESPETANVHLKMGQDVFYESFVKGFKPSYAYKMGKLEVEGDKNTLRLLDNLIVNSVAKL
ncbi:hypothetical protein PPYR_04900 [Photinus pyralis]|uniref:Hydroxysteroid dehydrogenase-like protein 2 n=1 Tax=Photinus pyralis TaxID=7054 RepID=A0A1Y1LMZ1_PHOPY|nr:hydroxysteroid dehydrogenase-like protein 2 [Photinus pyralis]KAB0802714.1 hypothetical protein PPYR_04900 [Photinus pyralis]